LSILTRSGNSSRHPSHQVAQKLISSGRVSLGSCCRIFFRPSRSISRISLGGLTSGGPPDLAAFASGACENAAKQNERATATQPTMFRKSLDIASGYETRL